MFASPCWQVVGETAPLPPGSTAYELYTTTETFSSQPSHMVRL